MPREWHASSRPPAQLLIAALGGEGGGVLTELDRRRPRRTPAFRCSRTSIPGVAQRTGATTYYIEMLPVQAADARRQAPGAGAHSRRRRYRHRGGERIAGSRPHRGQRLRHARSHPCHRFDSPLLRDGREDRDGRRPLRSGQAQSRSSPRMRATRCSSTWRRSQSRAAR